MDGKEREKREGACVVYPLSLPARLLVHHRVLQGNINIKNKIAGFLTCIGGDI